MRLCFIDFETFWSETHTLKRMSPVEYCVHPETELQFMSVKLQGGPTRVYAGEQDIRRGVESIDWSDVLAVGHNMSAFDAMLMAWRLGIKPAMWGCTLAMARPLHSKTVGLSLAKLVQHYGIGTKDNRALIQTRGRKMADFTAQEIADMRVYNADDTEQCAALFHKLKVHFTPAEMWHIDCNIRMLVEPRFDLDTGLLKTALSVERSNKHKALLDLAKLLRPRLEMEPCYDGADTPDFAADEHREFWSDEAGVAEWVREQMASAPKFSAVLESRGVEVPLKYSKTDPEKQIPAIAKTDEAMEELLDHDDEVVATAARARLSAKSTQLETRIQSFLKTYAAVGRLPVPAHYCGADTTGRDSGFMYNMLNLPRINPDKPKVSDALRNSVRAPKGKVILVRDLSGIELRVNHTLWKVQRSMDGWSAKPNWDLYRDTASRLYTCSLDEVQKPMRHYAKVLELASGYGQGPVTFRQTARIQGGLRLTPTQAEQGIKFWRDRYPEIAARGTGGWSICGDALAYIERGDKVPIDPWGLCTTEQDAIVLPSGRRIRYPGLRQEWVEQYRVVNGERVKKRERVWVYGEGRHRAFMHGPKTDENLVQAMARDVIFPQAIEFWKRTKLRPAHKVYDELVYVVDPSVADELSEMLGEIMRAPPPYWPELVLWSEGSYAETYGACK